MTTMVYHSRQDEPLLHATSNRPNNTAVISPRRLWSFETSNFPCFVLPHTALCALGGGPLPHYEEARAAGLLEEASRYEFRVI